MKRIINFIKKNYLWIIGIFCMIVLMAIIEEVFENEIMTIDIMAYNLFVVYLRNDFLTMLMKFITNLGSATVLVIITLFSYLFIKNKRLPMAITLNLIVITILNQILKFVVERPRPFGYRLIDESGYSFPSGHSMISLAFYGFIIYLIFKYVKNNKLKWVIGIILGIMILLIGISRIYLGVHYASDVVAGMLISTIYLIIFTKAIKSKL